MHLSRRGGITLAATVLGLFCWGAGRANADIMLTPAAVAQGFQLSTFATGFPSTPYVPAPVGPLGIAFPAGGGVLVTAYPGGVYSFPTNTDGQSAGSAIANYGRGNATGLAMVGNNIYMAQQLAGAVVQINANGSYQRTVATGLPNATGLVSNPVNGHLFVSSSGAGNLAVYEVDPTASANAVRTFLPNTDLDGLTITADGKTLYGATGTGVRGYDTTTGAVVWDSGFIPGGTDGASLGTGILSGNIFVNNNDGSIVEVNLATLAQTLIATGGSRGDFVTAAPDGSLLLTQSDSVVRLTAPSGGGFGNQLPAVPNPEPSTLALLGLGTVALAAWRWRRGRRRSA
jgi:hypothetical protein